MLIKKDFSFAHWLLAIFGLSLVTASCTSILGIDTATETNVCANSESLPPLTCGFGSCQQLIPACTGNGLPVLDCPAVTKTNDTDTCGDGIDNDCDGLVDENDIDTCTCKANEIKGCYTGAPGTRGKGLCRDGFQSCDQGTWGKCDGDVTPEQEIADGRDNDCDGSIDEELPCADGEELECYGGSTDTLGKGPCKSGKQTCKNGKWGDCVGQQLPAAIDQCNGFDDDCDGEVDNIGVPGSLCQCATGDTKSCYVNESGEKIDCPLDLQGECKCGTMTCGSNQQYGPCIGATKPTTDICDSKDNDCNGIIDNIGLPNTPCECSPGETQPCYTGPMGTEGVGPCKPGERMCVNGKFGACIGEVVPKGTDACDGQVDDDCNGVIDNVGLPGSPCVCMNNTTEICFTGPPEKLNVGACKAGQRTCTNGNWGICTGQTLPGVELCDGLDNDCNGGVDDGIPGVGDSCFRSEYAGTPCYLGKIECPLGGAGTPECISSTKPGFIPEKCDGIDNDCNLVADDGFFCCPNDGKVSGNETDLDCGGSCAQKCSDGAGCIVGIDCISGNCFQNQCKSATCGDGLKNGVESDVDCGEVCPMQCIVGKSCFTDNDCISKLCQPASKTCVQKPKGSACNIDAECSTGNCVDGVCCSSSCSGECQACTASKKGSGADGDCGPVAGNTDPDNECQVAAPETCGNTGVCSGTGSCAKYSLGTVCDPAFCTNSTTENPADTCDGQGVCVQKFDKACQTGYGCVAGACKTTCVSNGECDNGYFCNAPTCQIKKVNGDSCANGLQCQSGNCIDGVCCDSICTDTCKACNIAGSVGICSPIAANTDPLNECNPGSCDGIGQCQKSNGSSCATTAQCVSGNCIDGVCCNTNCLGTCVSCANSGSVGTCSNIPANADPNNECNPGQCDGLGDCQGVNSETCVVPADCASGFCVDGYCCDTACTGTCQACSGALKGQGANGTCGAILLGQDPNNECNPGACNGVGACQLPNGQSCMMNSQCASGTCVDGVCCNQACTGTCQACNVQNSVGTCVSVPANTDPANECNPGSCDGLGQCQVALGTSCTTANQCTSGFCTDGVCCDNVCSGLCQACTTALKGGGLNGQCGAIVAGQDPQNECDQEPASTCGKTGTCNGAGSCALYTNGTVCQGATCAGNTLVNADTCNGAGVCIDGGTMSCGAFSCNAGSCLGTCTNDTQCASGNYCNLLMNTCTPKLGQGTLCSGNNQCALGFCVDGVCCDNGCTTECKSCAVPGSVGTCTNVPAQQTDNSPACLGLQVCNGAGKCVDTNGQPCSTNNECFSQACIDLVCCENACLGTCRACSNTKTNQPNGTCAPIASNSDPDNECVGLTVCDGVGSCTKLPNGATCSAGTECTSNFCVDNVCCENSCTGSCKACTAAKTGGVDGTCGNVAADTDPDSECTTECNGSGACEAANGSGCMTGSQCQSGNCVDGVCCNTACNGPCQSCSKVAGVCSPDFVGQQDLCSMGSICDASGNCKKPTGDSCTLGTECLSGFCVDNFCCSAACSGSCEACSAAKTGGVNGTCSFIASNNDPDNECAGGECNGGGACEAANGSSCSMPTQCVSNSCVDNFCCDTTCSGTCEACSMAKTGSANGTCSPISANTDPDNECSANECNGSGACEFPNGTICTVNAQCNSGFCVDGVCCSSSCTGSCQACSAAKTGGVDGTCSFVSANTDPEGECTGTADCNGAGACELVNGIGPCTQNSQCVSGSCAVQDGVCCDNGCSGTCKACVVAKTGVASGTCSNVTTNTDPDAECATECSGAGACEAMDGAACPNGNSDCQSGYCAANTCQTPSCTDGIKNGTESDVDCGGMSGMVTCPACALLMFGGDTGRYMVASLPVDTMGPMWSATFSNTVRSDAPVALTMPNSAYGVGIIRDTQASNKLRYVKWTNGVWGSVTDVDSMNSLVTFGALSLGSSEGQALAAYREDTTKKLFYSRFDGTTWTPLSDLAHTLTSTNTSAALVPTIAGLPGGEAWMAYSEVNGANHEVTVRARVAGSWSGPTVLSLTVNTAVTPRVISLTNGELMVAYITSSSVGVKTRRRNAAGTWLGETAIPGGTLANMSTSANIALAPLPNGGAVIAYRNASNNRPMFSIWNGTTWTNPAEASADSVATSISVSRGMGGLLIELAYVDSTSNNAKHTRYNGTTWTPPATLGGTNDDLDTISIAAPPP